MNKTKIKHLSLSLLSIIAVGGAVLGLSRAFYQDVETLDPTISMGVLNLQVGEEDPANVPLDFSGMVPEEERSFTFAINNTGQVEGNFWVKPVITYSDEGEIPESEVLTVFNGDIQHCAKLTLKVVDSESNEVKVIDEGLIYSINNQSFESASRTLVDEAVNNGPTNATLTISAMGCGSEVMGDILKMDLQFYLTQI